MIAFAAHRGALLRRGADGLTALEHEESHARQTDAESPLFGGPPLPPEGEHVWAWFEELDRGRGTGGFGPATIGYLDVLAWAMLTGVLIRPCEVAAIMAIDRAWLAAQLKPAARAPTKGKRNFPPPRSSRPQPKPP